MKALLRPDSHTPTTAGYLYHGTGLDVLLDIAQYGIRTYNPWSGTDQSTWPDGATERRAYFAPLASQVWAFTHPDAGRPVILRVLRRGHPFKRESTGDWYTRKRVPPDKVEIGLADGTWEPIAKWAAVMATPIASKFYQPRED